MALLLGFVGWWFGFLGFDVFGFGFRFLVVLDSGMFCDFGRFRFTFVASGALSWW